MSAIGSHAPTYHGEISTQNVPIASLAAVPFQQVRRRGRPVDLKRSPRYVAAVHIQPTLQRRGARFATRKSGEYVLVICSGRAVSSITLPDGRRKSCPFYFPVMSFVQGSLFEPISGYAQTRYRRNLPEIQPQRVQRFCPELRPVRKTGKMWAEESERADQLALDLGRRRADERVAAFILNLADDCRSAHGPTPNDGFPLRQRHIADATG